MRSTAELLDELKRRTAEHISRIRSYERFLKAWGGDEQVVGLKVIGSNNDGRPVLRLVRSDNAYDPAERKGAPNLLKPVIDDYTALRGILPTITVLPESGEEQDQEVAVQRTRILRAQYLMSRMDLQQADAAFYLSCLGDCAYVLEPLTPADARIVDDPFSPPGIYITVVNPGTAFPRFRGGREQRELEDLYVVSSIDAREARDTYGVDPREEITTLVRYYSRTEVRTIVGDTPAATGNLEHNLGFCPAQWVCNKSSDGRYAQSDISAAVDTNDEARAMYFLYVEAMAWSVYPLTEFHDPDMISGENPEYGPGAKIETRGTGSIKQHAPQANVQAAQMILSMVQDSLLKMTGTSPIRVEGQIDRSNVSARSVTAQQGPMESRLVLQNTILGAHLQRLNAKILLMLNKLPAFRTAEMKVYVQEKGGAVGETFTGADLNGWWMNSVKWDPLIVSSKHEQVVIALQLYREKLVSRKYVLMKAGEDDPDLILREADADLLAQLRMQQSMGQPDPNAAAGPQGAPPGQPGGDVQGPAQEGVGLGAGAMLPPSGGANGAGAAPALPGGGGPTPPPPPFPPMPVAPGTPGVGRAQPVPDIVGAVKSALDGLTLHGDTPQPFITQRGVEIDVTDHRDIRPVKDAVSAALQTVAPGMHLIVKALSTKRR